MGVAASIYALLWAIGQSPNVVIVLVYSLALGNMGGAILSRFGDYDAKLKPWRFWLVTLVRLVAITPMMVLVATVLVFWSDPRPNGGRFLLAPFRNLFWPYLATSWKFPAVATIIFGIGIVMKNYMQHRNQELQKAVDSASAAQQLQKQDLDRAREIQQGLLPKALPELPGYEIAGTWEPARTVGGDYFDVIKLSERKLGICIADVVGKGVAAALLMANVQAALRAFASESASPAWVCGRINSILCGNIASSKFVTLFYGVLDSRLNTLRYCNAGHLRPILIGEAGRVRQLDDNSALLGVFPDWQYTDSLLQLEPGDRMILYTDGITEAARQGGEEFGEARLIDWALDHKDCSSGEFQQQLLVQVKHFCDLQLSDDATLIVLDVLGRQQIRQKRHGIEVVSAA